MCEYKCMHFDLDLNPAGSLFPAQDEPHEYNKRNFGVVGMLMSGTKQKNTNTKIPEGEEDGRLNR